VPNEVPERRLRDLGWASVREWHSRVEPSPGLPQGVGPRSPRRSSKAFAVSASRSSSYLNDIASRSVASPRPLGPRVRQRASVRLSARRLRDLALAAGTTSQQEEPQAASGRRAPRGRRPPGAPRRQRSTYRPSDRGVSTRRLTVPGPKRSRPPLPRRGRLQKIGLDALLVVLPAHAKARDGWVRHPSRWDGVERRDEDFAALHGLRLPRKWTESGVGQRTGMSPERDPKSAQSGSVRCRRRARRKPHARTATRARASL
jgi:hypothetical protein